MMPPSPPARRCIARGMVAAVLLCAAGGCVVSRSTVEPLYPWSIQGGQVREVTRPAKVHLVDGSVVLFPEGFTVEGGVLRGAGELHDLTRTRREPVTTVPAAEVAAVEEYARAVDPGASLAASVVAAPYLLFSAYALLSLLILLSL